MQHYYLLDVLRCTAKLNGSSPCWIRQSSQWPTAAKSNNQCDEFLTYDDAVSSVHCHAEALEASISELEEESRYFKDNDVDYVTIVYLCNNSLDFALSILAASQLASIALGRVGQQLQETKKKIRCALLNTRWSTAESVAALGPAQVILLVHGLGWHESAQSLQSKLHSHRKGPCQLLALPNFGAHFLEMTTSHNKKALLAKGPSNQHHSLPMLSASGNGAAWTSLFSPDDAVLVFTSGTTSIAKGVRLSHRALLSQAAAKVSSPCAYSSTTRMFSTTVPFFHVGGLSSLLAVWMTGGALIEPPSNVSTTTATGGFDASTIFESLSHSMNPCNTLVVVPAMIHAMQQQQQQQQQQTSRRLSKAFPHVELILVGGQSLSTPQRTFLRQVFPRARLVQTFACTEAASSLTFWDVTTTTSSMSTSTQQSLHRDQASVAPGVCVGYPPAHVELRLFRKTQRCENDTSLDEFSIVDEPFRVGLIGTRGPHVMNGYWGQEHSNYSPTNWYITSDYGYWDHSGHLYFCGRQTDTIRTGGETVWATEVEQVLQQHEHIAEVAVLGLPDDRFGETVACALVLERATEGFDLKQLRSWCTARGLAGYKQPRRLAILSSLPRNTSGKVLKHRLKDRFGPPPHSRL